MLRKCVGLTTAILAFALVLAGQAHADKWDDMLAAGRKDGKVVVTGPAFPGLRDKVVSMFKADTGIDVEWKPLVGGPGLFIASLLREAQAKSISTDVYIGGSTSCFDFAKQDTMVDLTGIMVNPDVIDPSKWRDGKLSYQTGDGKLLPANFRCFLEASYYVEGDIFINTKLVKPDAIKSWKDLLDPKYKGKMVSHDPRAPGAGRATAAYLYALFGEDYVRKLYAGQDVALVQNYTQGPDDVARGRYWIALGQAQAVVEKLAKEGLPIARIFPKDGMGATASSLDDVALLKGPNRAAGAVFVNWWGTKRAQDMAQCELLEASRRVDVTTSSCLPAWILPQPGVAYPIYADSHKQLFGPIAELQSKSDSIFGR